MKRNERLAFAGVAALALIAVPCYFWFDFSDEKQNAVPSADRRASLPEKNALGDPLLPSGASVIRPNSASSPKAGSPKKTEVQPIVKAAVENFEAELKELEAKRVTVFPIDPKDNGNKIRISISEPKEEEIAEISILMSAELHSMPEEFQADARNRLQEKYNDYVSFKLPYRILEGIRGIDWPKMQLMDGYTSDPNSPVLRDAEVFLMDPKVPAAENRFSHLFELHNR